VFITFAGLSSKGIMLKSIYLFSCVYDTFKAFPQLLFSRIHLFFAAPSEMTERGFAVHEWTDEYY
jgi:hypothetical protein